MSGDAAAGAKPRPPRRIRSTTETLLSIVLGLVALWIGFSAVAGRS